MDKRKNIVGPIVRKIRSQRNLTQEVLAARCNVRGWSDLSRSTLSKIEAQLRCVTDIELKILAEALNLKVDELYPQKHGKK